MWAEIRMGWRGRCNANIMAAIPFVGISKMSKREWEYIARDRFIGWLKRSKDEDWQVLEEDYCVEPGTRKNFDFQLAFGKRRMALELFRLTEDGATLAAQYTWIEIATAIERE